MEHGAGPGTQEEASTSGAAQQPLFSWNVARWALGARGTQQPPPAVASAAAASLSPHAAGQVSAAAEAAAALTAWEEAKASRRGYGGGGGGVAAPASLVQQPQQQLADAQFAAADDFDEEEFEEEEEEEGEWDTYRPLKLLLAGGAWAGSHATCCHLNVSSPCVGHVRQVCELAWLSVTVAWAGGRMQQQVAAGRVGTANGAARARLGLAGTAPDRLHR